MRSLIYDYDPEQMHPDADAPADAAMMESPVVEPTAGESASVEPGL